MYFKVTHRLQASNRRELEYTQCVFTGSERPTCRGLKLRRSLYVCCGFNPQPSLVSLDNLELESFLVVNLFIGRLHIKGTLAFSCCLPNYIYNGSCSPSITLFTDCLLCCCSTCPHSSLYWSLRPAGFLQLWSVVLEAVPCVLHLLHMCSIPLLVTKGRQRLRSTVSISLTHLLAYTLSRTWPMPCSVLTDRRLKEDVIRTV